MVESLAAKIGIPPAIAELIVNFVLSKLQGGMGQRGGGQEVDMETALQQMSGDGRMVVELAEQTGLDSRTAMQGMQEVLDMLGSQNAG